MNPELDTIPAEWSSGKPGIRPEEGLSPYSIERILPADNRRFLQLRESFLTLCENQPARAGILECARFELSRQLRQDASGKKRDLLWRETQCDILRGPNPTSADLWAPFPNDRIIERLCGLVTHKGSIGESIKLLEKSGWIFVGKAKRPRNGRTVLLNVKQIERDLRDHPFYEGSRWSGAVKGSPEKLFDEPDKQIFTPIYSGLVEVVVLAANQSRPDSSAARAAMLLYKIIRRAETREQAGEEIPAAWSQQSIVESFGWGRREAWAKALARLVDLQLVIEIGRREKALVVAPNLSRINELVGSKEEENGQLIPLNPSSGQDLRMGTIGISDRDNQTYGSKQSDSRTGAIGITEGDNAPSLSTEGFSDCLTEILTERKTRGDFNPGEILASHSLKRFEVRRATHFSLLPLQDGWERLGFADLAQSSVEEAAAALLLAEDLRCGRRSAVAFPKVTTRSRAMIALFIGHWIDCHFVENVPTEWMIVDSEAIGVINGSHRDEAESRARKALTDRLRRADNPLVIEAISESSRHEQMRDELVEAIRGRLDNLMPVIYLGLPPTLAELRKKLKEDRLADLVLQSIRERPQLFEIPEISTPDSGSGGGGENPFL